MNTHEQEISKRIASTLCSTCGGPAPHWKCPKCGEESEGFDPMHWRECRFEAKMQAKCETCNEAEENCTCEQA